MPFQAHTPRSPNGNGAASAFIPPYSIEAEQSTLGAMLIERSAAEKVFSVLNRNDFYRENHQLLFDVIGCLARRGEPIDLITMQAELKDRNQLDAIGGITYLMSLFDTVPTAANVEHYAKIVEEKAIQRRAAFLALDILAATREGIEDTGQFIADLQTKIGSISKGKSIRQRKPFAETIIRFRDIPPPPAELPYLFGPYLNAGASHWLTGQTGVGKSTWLYNVLPALAEGREIWGIPCKKTNILYLDMESGQVGQSLKADRLFPERQDFPGLANLFMQSESPRFPADLPAMLAFIEENRIGLVVFDTARRCFSVEEENSNSEFYMKIVPILDAIKAAGVASLTMGHPPKNGGAGARGAGAQEDAGDVNLTLTMHRGEISDDGATVALRVTKNRLLGLGIAPLHLRRLGKDQFERLDTGESRFTEELPAAPTAKEKCAQDILEYLRQSAPAKHNQIVKEMVSRGHAEGTAKKTITWLQQEEMLIENNLDTGGYSVTPSA